MLNVNDDMEELMRRAAENYPLKADGNDFDKVLEGIKAFNPEGEPKQPKGNNKRMLWLLLLLPFAFICNNYYRGNKTGESSTPGIAVETHTTTATSPLTKNDVGTQGSLSHEKKSTGEKDLIYNKRTKMKSGNTSIRHSKIQRAGFSDKVVVLNDNKAIREFTVAKNKQLVSVHKNMKGTKYAVDFQKSLIAKSGNEVENPNTNTNVVSTEGKSIASGVRGGIDPGIKTTPDDPTLREVYQDEVKHLEMSMQKDTSKQKTVAPVTPAVTATAAPKEKKQSSKKLYAGLMGGPDISTVKYNSVSKIGYSFGLLTGYRANKKITIESGVFWSKRFYKSEGKYFDTKKLPIPAYVKIISLDGYCQMYELPVGVTYQLKAGKNNTWFSALGLSTYFMKNEDYNYNYLSYGQARTRYVTYDNSANNWFSILNVSVGINKSIAKNAWLRIQPYVKIPLKGIGIGSLPVSGAGLQAGIVKNIF
jgi:hypothetical protein